MWQRLTRSLTAWWLAPGRPTAARHLNRVLREGASDPEPWDEAAHPPVSVITRSRHAGAQQPVSTTARRREAKRARQLRKQGRRARQRT